MRVPDRLRALHNSEAGQHIRPATTWTGTKADAIGAGAAAVRCALSSRQAQYDNVAAFTPCSAQYTARVRPLLRHRRTCSAHDSTLAHRHRSHPRQERPQRDGLRRGQQDGDGRRLRSIAVREVISAISSAASSLTGGLRSVMERLGLKTAADGATKRRRRARSDHRRDRRPRAAGHTDRV